MQVHVSADGRTKADFANVTAEVENGLARFAARLTRAEVHLSDVNGPKGGVDCRCVFEVRPASHQPVVVTSNAGSPEEAVSDAVQKMDHLLNHTFGRLDHAKGGTSASGLPT